MNMPADAFKAKREEAQREVLVPPFPADVVHYDDGSWECSGESFDRMTRSFKRFGFELDYRWSFDMLYARFSFVLRSSSLISALDLGWVQEKHEPALVTYLQAVAARDDSAVAQALPAALQVEADRISAAEAVLSEVALDAPQPDPMATNRGPGRGHLYLVPQ